MTPAARARQTDPVPETPDPTEPTDPTDPTDLDDLDDRPDEPALVALARRIASDAHRGVSHRDKQQRDYVEAHLAPVAAGCALFGVEAEAAGWLHDVVEDTGLGLADLEREGIPQEVRDAVDSVTEREGEPYTQLVHRAAADPIGAVVKLVDNAWNLLGNADLARTHPEDAQRLLDKYLPARAVLLAATGVTALQVHELDVVLRARLARLAA